MLPHQSCCLKNMSSVGPDRGLRSLPLVAARIQSLGQDILVLSSLGWQSLSFRRSAASFPRSRFILFSPSQSFFPQLFHFVLFPCWGLHLTATLPRDLSCPNSNSRRGPNQSANQETLPVEQATPGLCVASYYFEFF